MRLRVWAALASKRWCWTCEATRAALSKRRSRVPRTSLRSFAAGRDREALVEELVERGVPAAAVTDPRRAREDPQLTHRRFFERFDHCVVGSHPAPSVPFRYGSVEAWLRAPAPTLGQHNREILRDFCGFEEGEIDALEAAGVIGVRPEGL